MIQSIALTLYLLIGIYNARKMLDVCDEVIESYEDGEELDDHEKEFIDHLTQASNMMNMKVWTVLLFIFTTIFWLPLEVWDFFHKE